MYTEKINLFCILSAKYFNSVLLMMQLFDSIRSSCTLQLKEMPSKFFCYAFALFFRHCNCFLFARSLRNLPSRHNPSKTMKQRPLLRASESGSLESYLTSAMRFTLSLSSLPLARSFMAQSRILLRLSLTAEGSIVVSKQGPCIDRIEVVESIGHDSSSKDCIIYVHGGAFSLCDSTDLFIFEKLLPLLGENPPSVYSIMYDTSPNPKSSSLPTYLQIQSQVIDAYEEILSTGKRVLCLIGDSAGGALAMRIILHIQEKEIQQTSSETDGTDMSSSRKLEDSYSKEVGGLILLSPWTDFFSQRASHCRNSAIDILDTTFLSKSIRQYLGKEIFEWGSLHEKMIIARNLAEEFVKSGIKVVVFDMDQCIVNMHSMGRLKRKDFQLFSDKVNIDFILFARELHKVNVKLAVGTHSDSIEYNSIWRPPSEYLIGQELVEKLLSTVLPEIKDDFFIFCYNPTAQKDDKKENAFKKLHIRQTSLFYGVSQSECVLFDDDVGNVLNTDGLFRSYIVNWKKGFLLDSFLVNQVQTKKFHFSTPENNSEICGLTNTAENIKELKILEEQEGDESNKMKIGNMFDGNIEQNIEETKIFWKNKGIQNPENIFPQLLCKEQLSKFPPTLIFGGESELFIDDITSFSQRLLSAKYSISNQTEIHSFKSIQQSSSSIEKSSVLPKITIHDKVGTCSSDNSVNEDLNNTSKMSEIASNEMASESRAEIVSEYTIPIPIADNEIKSKFIIGENDLHVYPVFLRHPVHRIMRPLGMTWLFRILFPHRDKCNKISANNAAENMKLHQKTEMKSPENCSKFKIVCGDGSVDEALNTVAPSETLSATYIESASLIRNMDDAVHYNVANEAIQCMAQFILDIRNAK